MSEIEKNFFKGKREWSKLKDEVLGKYLAAYFNKVNRLGKPIIFVDSFAGPGQYGDGNGNYESGSPLIFCELAEEHVPNNYFGIFGNENKKHHDNLTALLKSRYNPKKFVTLRGSADNLLNALHMALSDQTLFIYLDPFGLEGTDFATLQKYLERDYKKYSTELFINLSVSTIVRYSCRNVLIDGIMTDDIKMKQNIVSKALGGDYWKDHLLNSKYETTECRQLVIDEYIKKLKSFMPYVGYCPVYKGHERSTLKYVLVFTSRHIDAQLLMNDIMFDSYKKYIWKAKTKDTLFESLTYEDDLSDEYFRILDNEIVDALKNKPPMKRIELWKTMLSSTFMRYHSKHFRKAIVGLIKRKVVYVLNPTTNNKLNDESFLALINYGNQLNN